MNLSHQWEQDWNSAMLNLRGRLKTCSPFLLLIHPALCPDSFASEIGLTDIRSTIESLDHHLGNLAAVLPSKAASRERHGLPVLIEITGTSIHHQDSSRLDPSGPQSRPGDTLIGISMLACTRRVSDFAAEIGIPRIRLISAPIFISERSLTSRDPISAAARTCLQIPGKPITAGPWNLTDIADLAELVDLALSAASRGTLPGASEGRAELHVGLPQPIDWPILRDAVRYAGHDLLPGELPIEGESPCPAWIDMSSAFHLGWTPRSGPREMLRAAIKRLRSEKPDHCSPEEA